MKDTLIDIALFVVALMIIIGATWHFAPDGDSNEAQSQEDIAKTIAAREIIDYSVEEGVFSNTVRYAYLGDPLPATLHENEIVSLRTSSSYSIETGIENEGTADEKAVVSLIAYPQDAFIQRDGVWYYIEHDEAPQDIFERVTKRHSILHALFGTTAYAVTDTIYTGGGDGYVYTSQQTSWGGAHDAASGLSLATSSDVISVWSYAGVGVGKSGATTYGISRAFLPFVTSSIPADATITAATMNVHVTNVTNSDNDGADYITVVQTDQATHTILTLDDYNNAGTVTNPIEGIDTAQRKDLTGMATGTLAFTLNATGLGWIKKNGESSACSATAGVSCFGLREGHDTTNTVPDAHNQMQIHASEYAGTAEDPYLSVTYTVPSRMAFWMFSDF